MSLVDTEPRFLFVTGVTFLLREQLKALGGSWYPEMKCWVLPTSARERLMALASPLLQVCETAPPPPKTTAQASTRADDRANLQCQVESLIRQATAAGLVKNRDDVVAVLRQNGLELPRIGGDYLTVLDPNTDVRVRMRGGTYAASTRATDSADALVGRDL